MQLIIIQAWNETYFSEFQIVKHLIQVVSVDGMDPGFLINPFKMLSCLNMFMVGS